MVLINQLRVDKRDCERMRVQVVHNRVALNNSNASTDSDVRGERTTHLKRGKSQTVAMNVAKLRQAESVHLEKRDVRIKPGKARVIQSGALGAKRECLSKLVSRLERDRTDDDAEDERNEEVLCDCFFPQYIVSPGTSPTMRKQSVKCDETAVILLHSRQSDDEQCKPVHKSVADEQCPQFKVVCSQTLASRISSKNSSFALDAG